MNQRLSDWLVGFSVDDGARQAAIDAASLHLRAGTAREAADLVCRAFRLPSGNADALIHDAVSEHDPTFDSTRDVAQVQITAAFAVARLLEDDEVDEDLATLTALSVQAAMFAGGSAPQRELDRLGRQRLAKAGGEHRARPVLPVPAQPRALDKLAERPSADAPDATAPTPTDIVEAARSAVSSLYGSMRRLASAAGANLKADAEELEMLWWSFADRYDGDGPRWSELGEGAGILAGVDLAARTMYPSPQPSSVTLLDRAVGRIPSASLGRAAREAAAKLPPLGEFEAHPLLAVHAALAEPDGVVDDQERSQVALGEQMLCETLIRRGLD